MQLWDRIADQRLGFVALLETLEPAQWDAPTLCGAWDVRHLVAHLTVGPTTPKTAFVAELARRGFSFDRAALVWADRYAKASTDAELVATLRRIAASRFAPPVLGPIAPYVDLLVHRQDVVIPLGLPDPSTPDDWRDALAFALGRLARVGFVSGRVPALRYVATDLDQRHGEGPEVTGSARALALALLRRTPLLGELGGPGATVLRGWAVPSLPPVEQQRG